MQVTLERGGGVAGASNHQRLGPIDTQTVDGDAGHELERLVAEADFFEMDHEFPRTGGQSDPTWNSVRVVDGDGDRTVRWDANQKIPEPLRELRNLASSLGEWQPAT